MDQTRKEVFLTAIPFSGSELINIAIGIERRGTVFYDIMTRSTKNAVARDVFQYLADMEREHVHIFQSMLTEADKYQVPVFILTDNYLVNLYYNLPQFDLTNLVIENHVVKTEKDYKRYKLTESGISPRGIPGYGDGLVGVDSHEHDEEAHISEDLHYMRIKMVEKRLKKLNLLEKDVIRPELIGNENYKTLLIGWGSTFYLIKEAMELLKKEDISFLHFKQVFPLHPKTSDYLSQADKTVLIENNTTGQFGKLIKLYTGIDVDAKILKSNGLPFSVEELIENLENVVK